MLAFCCGDKILEIISLKRGVLFWLTGSEISVHGYLTHGFERSKSWWEHMVEEATTVMAPRWHRQEGPGSQYPL